MITEIKERIGVNVFFSDRKIKILWFIWRDKKYFVKKITFFWKISDGEKEKYCFALNFSGANRNVIEQSLVPQVSYCSGYVVAGDFYFFAYFEVGKHNNNVFVEIFNSRNSYSAEYIFFWVRIIYFRQIAVNANLCC